MLAECVDLVGRVAGESPIAAVGIGLCELVSSQGRPASAITIDWLDLDVAEAFAPLAPVHVESDVRAAALAEGCFGAARGVCEPWLYVSVGTGISFSLVINGRPFRGARGNAIVLGAPPVELVASGLALQRQAGCPTAEEVLAESSFAPLVAEAAVALGRALAMLVNALDPALIVVGGGLGLVGSYREAAAAAMRLAIEAPDSREVPVVAALLGTVGGAMGAGLAAATAIEATGQCRQPA